MLKRKQIVTFFLAVVLLLTLIPATALAATTNETTLKNLKASGIKTYDTAMPKAGSKITENKLASLLKKYPYKDNTKGNSFYSYGLSFNSDSTKLGSGYTYAAKSKGWSQASGNAYYSEEFILVDKYTPKNVGKTRCSLYTEDKTYTYNYSWIKGQKTGELYKSKKTSGDGGGTSTSKLEIRLCPDQTVLGQKCFVYSQKWSDSTSTSYIWRSMSTGKTVKYAYEYKSGSYYSRHQDLTFADYRMDKASSVFKKPAGIKFTEYK